MTSQDALIAYFVETSGITSPTQAAELLGVPAETARKWMRRYRTMRADPTGQISPVGDIDRSNPPKPVKSDRSNQTAPRVRANKESPSEIVITRQLASNARACEREIEGLNGSTPIFVDRLARIMADPMLGQVPDYELAYRLIETNVVTYDAMKVKIGIAELEADIAEKGKRPNNWAKAFSGFVKQASPDAKPSKTHLANGRVTASEWDRVIAESQAEGAA